MTQTEQDAARYRWLVKHLRFELGAYECESGRMEDATKSHWLATTFGIFQTSSSQPPKSLDEAIDAAM